MTLAQINWPLILAGFGLFLFGIEFMGDGLKNFSGDKLKNAIDKYTSSPLKGILIGTASTCLLQSSSGTTALTIGLIRSGLMTLEQGVGIIMGANIGTVITAFLVGIDISEYSVYFIAVGAILFMFSKRKRYKYIGQILFGFGCLFYGLELMGSNLKEITEVAEFSQVVNIASNNTLLGLIGGTIFTMVIQSSSAVIAIVQELYGAKAFGLSIALPFLFGSNIGTTITAVLAAIGGSVAAKRAAVFHVLFNVIGAIIFMILLIPFSYLITELSILFGISRMMQLALAHAIFNITMTILFFPFIAYIVRLVKFVIPSSDKEIAIDLSTLDPNVINLMPTHALELARGKVMEMGELASEIIVATSDLFKNKNLKKKETILEIENAINTMDDKISDYLIALNQNVLNEEDANIYYSTLRTIKDLERIGDICIAIIKFIEPIYESKEEFTQQGRKDIEKMFNLSTIMVERAMLAYQNHDLDDVVFVDDRESEMDYINKKARKHHIDRVSNHLEKSNLVKSTYIDIISNLERIGDHCQNIAESYDIDEDLDSEEVIA